MVAGSSRTLYCVLVSNADDGKCTAARLCVSVPVKPYIKLSTGLGLARLLAYWRGFLRRVIWLGSSSDMRARMTGEWCASASTFNSKVSGPSVDVNNNVERITKSTLGSGNTCHGNANSSAHVGKMARAPMGGTGGMIPMVGAVVAMLVVTSWQLSWPRGNFTIATFP